MAIEFEVERNDSERIYRRILPGEFESWLYRRHPKKDSQVCEWPNARKKNILLCNIVLEDMNPFFVI